MGIASETEGDQSAVARLLDDLVALNRELGIPAPEAYGIDPQRWKRLLETMAKQALPPVPLQIIRAYPGRKISFNRMNKFGIYRSLG